VAKNPASQNGRAHHKAREREEKCWALRVQGYSHRAIAERVGLTHRAVAHALERAEDRLLARLERRIQYTKARQSAQLEQLLYEAMTAWEASKAPRRRVRRRETAEGVETVTEVTAGVGDARFLTVALEILRSERQLWGLDKPPAWSVPGGDGDGDADGDVDATLAAMIREARSEVEAGLPPPEVKRRRAWKVEQLRAELTALEKEADDAEEAEAGPDAGRADAGADAGAGGDDRPQGGE
jgi:hypothetical protein